MLGSVRDSSEQEGAVALEFALLVPVLVLLFFGITQFALAFHRTQALQAAGHEAARLGALQGTTVEQIGDRIEAALAPIAAPEAWGAACPPPDGGFCWMVSDEAGGSYAADDRPCATASQVVVAVQHRRQVSVPLFGDPVYTLTGSGEFRCER